MPISSFIFPTLELGFYILLHIRNKHANTIIKYFCFFLRSTIEGKQWDGSVFLTYYEFISRPDSDT